MIAFFWRIWASRYSRLLSQKEVHGKSPSSDKGVEGPGANKRDMARETLGMRLLDSKFKGASGRLYRESIIAEASMGTRDSRTRDADLGN